MDFSSAIRRRKKPIITAAVIVVLYTVAGFFVFPAVIGSVLPEKLAQALNRQVTLDKVRCNPYALSITLENLTVADKDGGPLAGFDRFYANLQTSSLFRWGAVFSEIRIEGLDARIVRTGEALFNFSDLIPATEASAQRENASAEGGPRFSVRQLFVTGGRLDFEDRFVDSRHRVDGIDIQVADLSSLPAGTGKKASVTIRGAVDGATVLLVAEAQPFSAEPSAEAKITVKDLKVPRYLAYLPAKPDARIESALLSLEIQGGFVQEKDAAPSLSLSGAVRLSQVKIFDRADRPMLQIPEIGVLLGKSRPLSGEVTVDEIRISAPEVLVVRSREGEMNLLDLVPDAPGTDDEGREQAEPAGVSLLVKQCMLSSGKVRFADEAVDGGFQTALSGIDFSMEGFSLAPESSAAFRLFFATDAEESVSLEGAFSLSPVKTDGRFDVRDIELARYVPYAADLLNFEIRGGRLSVGGRFAYAPGQDSDAGIKIEEGEAALRSLVLYRAQDQEQVVSIPAIDVKGVFFSQAERMVGIGEFSSEKGELFYLRTPDGKINLADMVALPEATPAPVAEEPPAPMQISVDRIRVGEYRIRMEDRVPAETVQTVLSDVRIEAQGLSNRPGAAGQIALGFQGARGGMCDVQGRLALAPLSADVQVKLNRIDIRAFQPYFTDRVKIIVTGGTASVNGHLVFDAAGKGPPSIRYAGRAEINGFSSVDKEDTLDFLNWDSLYLADMVFMTPPVSLSIEEVGLSGFYSRFIIDEDGSINVSDAVAGGDGGRDAPQEEKPGAEAPGADSGTGKQETEAPNISIRAVTLQDGHINFTDRFNPFNFGGDLIQIGGRVSGLSSLEADRADVLLSGSWESRAPLQIEGQINPLAENRYADLTLTIKDIDLSPFSPYSGKFLGYKLEKGLLTLELGYLLKGSHLKGDNRALFEELTLGERVDSEHAVSLPVSLAISLLKDPNGNITLDVPVEGDLNDPKFSLGRTILKVLGNLLVKIVTAPFAFLGNMIGGGEELSFVDFAPGSTEITPEAEKKLDALTAALVQRPALKLEIQGDADLGEDPEALRRKKFEDLMKSQKLKETSKKGGTAVPLDQIEISKEEYPQYLKRAYDAADFAKPRDANGNIKELPPEEMEKLLLTQFIFTETDLRQLAVDRADAVKGRLLETGQVGSGRLFIVEPRIRSADEAEKEADQSRVRFTLR
jgi:hypothetical protein